MDVRCLGPLQVVEAGRPQSLGGPKQRLVLAHLLIRANHLVPVDRLIAEVWDDDPPSAARASLQSYVSHLRSALGADRIQGSGSGYLLRVTSDEVDRSRFEALVAQGRRLRATDPARAAALLRDALKLWRGPPFADLSEAASLRPEITRLTELQLAAVEDRVGADLDLGRDRELVGELEALTAEHPLREGLWGQLMLALYRAGRQGDALLAFDRARSVLADELGIDPSAGLRALHEQVLRQDPTLRSATSTLKGYRLRERVGEGRFGVTWRAMQPGVDRDVAIKVARPALANDPEFIRRFAADAQRVAQLEHPHVMPLYDFWREPDSAYLVMRYLRGGSLRDQLDREGPPEHTDAVRIADQIAQALAAAHRQGVVHGDIRSANVLLDDDGNAYLSGFLVGYDGAPADSDRDADKLPYVPPERTTTDGVDDPKPRGDVYALGVLLGQLLPDADAAVAEVLGRATAPHPDQRQQDGRALLAELRAALEPTPPMLGAAATGTVVADGAGLRNPYKGLRAFLETDAGDFFGRRTMIARLLFSLREHGRFLAVVGPSGSGKSSVVRAGLVPALRAGALHGSGSWFIVQMVPGNRPFDELATAVRHVAVDPPENLAGHLADKGLAAVAPLLPDDGDLLLIIDQFEELFTLVTDDDRRNRFIDALVKAVDANDSRVRVVVTLRADFYDRPLEHAGLGALMQAHTHTLLPLAAGELEQAVTGPAESVGVAVERRLVAQMVADVTDQPGALPLLQYALTELFDSRTDATLTAEAYQHIGGIAGALSRRAEAVFSSLDNDAREAARQLFLRLVTPGEGVEDTRRRALVADVTALAPDLMSGVLDAFGDARLLSFDRDAETRAPTVEVAHEALLREWRRLRGWIDAARHDLRTQRRLQTAAADWVAADRDPSFLATGSQLAQYEAWRDASGMTATAAEATYLDASVADRDRAAAAEEARRQRELDLERRSVRRLRTLVAVLGIAALIAGGLTIFAIGQATRAADQTVRAEREARVATAGGLVAAADASLDVDPERSILLALEAIDVTRAADGTVLSEAEEALHRAVGASRIVRRFTDVGGDVDWHPDGTTLVHEGADFAGVVEILDAVTGEQVQSWQGHDGDVNAVEFSPDGSMLATTGDDGAARIWDPQTGEELAALEEDDGEVGGSAFSADSTLFAVVSLRTKECGSLATSCGGVKVSDIRSGRVILDRRFGERPPLTTAFSPDGERLVLGFDRPPEAIVIDVRTGRRLVTLAAHGLPTLDAAWSPDGRWLATTSDDNTARIWDGRTGEPRFTLGSHTAAVRDVDWHPGSTRLVLGSVDGTATVWQITNGGAQELLSLAGEPFDGMAGVAFSPEGDRVVTGDHDRSAIAIWDVRDLGAGEWATAPAQTLTRNPIDFTHDGAGVVATGGDGLVTIWDATDSSTVRAKTEHITSDTDPRFIDSVPEVQRLDANPAHPLVAAAAYREGGAYTAIVWDTDTGEQVFAVRHDVRVSDVTWSGDGELLASSDFHGVIRVVDRSGTELAVLRDEEDRPIDPLQFSPDGRHIIATTRTEQAGAVSVWDWERSEVIHVIEDHRFPGAFAFDADGGRVVIADGEGYAAVWDTASWTRLTTFTGHAGPVEAVDVAPDGQSVATAGAAGTVRIWDMATGAERLTLEAHGGIVWGIAFSPDGTRLASAGDDGQVRVWALDTDDLIGIAKDKLTRSLTDAECREYLRVDECPAE